MPVKCRFCGKELSGPDCRFCDRCGQPVPLGGSAEQRAEPPARLLVRVPGEPLREIPLVQPKLTVGRGLDNQLVLSPYYVSGRHGLLERKGSAWHYRDLNSTNGTFVNGQRAQSSVLRDGDVLRIGDPHGNSVSLVFRAAGASVVAEAVPPAVDLGVTSFQMKTLLLVGRDPQADVHLQAPTVSWHHARLDRTARGHVLTDLNSTNGTFVNGQRLARPQLLSQGDVVQIGPFRLIYAADGLQQYSTAGGVRLDGIRLTRDVGRGDRRKRILNDASVSVYPREFVGIVGTSGAGKSTLLMALNGFERADGQVLVNGDDLYGHFDLYRTLVGYVPQDDIVHEELTVASALSYAARLRLPSDTSAEEIEQRIDHVLQQVEMVAQRDQLISSLSGGQRKRVSIAVELLAEPNLFFLDEPTSGLDPGLEKKMMHTLRRLADEGRTILLVTHATANIVQCDHVCFLAYGRVVYFGPPGDALAFFEVTSGSFADIYGELDDPDPKLAQEKAATWAERFRRSPYYQRYVAGRQRALPALQETAVGAESRQRPRVSTLRQFFVLTRRYLDLVLRDKLLLMVLMAVMPMVGGLLLLISERNWLVGDPLAEIQRRLGEALASGEASSTYSVVGNTQTLLFMMALASVLLGLFAAVYEIVKEWSVYQRERMVALRIGPYLASKVVVLGGFALVQCLLLIVVVRLRVQMPRQGVLLPALLEMYITLVLGTLAAILLGLFISAVVPHADAVIYILFLTLFFQIIFAGVLFDLPGVSNHLSNFTLTRWTMEGLGTSSNMEWLDGLTRTRFQPDDITEEVSMLVERPAPDWVPVTVVTVTEEVEVVLGPDVTQTVPISVPQVTVHEVVSVTDVITQGFTVQPEAVDIFSEQDFRIRYDRTAGHLLLDWLMLIGFALVFAGGTAAVLRRKDVG